MDLALYCQSCPVLALFHRLYNTDLKFIIQHLKKKKIEKEKK